MPRNVTNIVKRREEKRVNKDSLREERLQENLGGNAIHLTNRRQGAPPKSSENVILITSKFKEGPAKYARAGFRRINMRLKEYPPDEIRHVIESGGYDYDDFEEVFDWVNSIEIPPSKKKRERDGITTAQYNEILRKAESNPLTCVAHRISKEVVEKFFRDYRLRFLFRVLAP
jgi:hypothetical protein